MGDSMASFHTLLFIVLILFCYYHALLLIINNVFSRRSFPQEFVFGASSAAFQYEGAVHEDGRKPSIWDPFSHIPGKITDGSNVDVAQDHYHRYKEDIELLAAANADAFRFSIAWPRIIPDGKGPVNTKGIDHYNKVIDEILRKGLKPYITLFHWDLPLALEKAYGGLLSPQFVKDYVAYAEVLFEAFGDRVKHWITFNEPHMFTMLGYNGGIFAPGRCSSDVGSCSSGDSSTEPYIVGHHMLIAHAEASAVYNKKFKASQGGEIGITLDSPYYEPFSNSQKDVHASEKALHFSLGWFLSPVIYGDYPAVMRTKVGKRLPKFSHRQAELLRRSADFVGINHYTTVYAADARSNLRGSPNLIEKPSSLYHPIYYKDTEGLVLTDRRGGIPIGQFINGFYVYPPGMRKLMNFIRTKYKNPKIYITENGISDITNDTTPLPQVLEDSTRLYYIQNHMMQLKKAISDGCNVKAYFIWSFLDTWEWSSGAAKKFGLVHIDYKKKLKRIPKASYYWYRKFLERH